MSKTVFITGASSGIGEAIALHLLSVGYRVYGASRRDIESRPDGIRFIKMDVDDPDSVNKAINQLMEEIQVLDVVVNCAGLGIMGAIEEVPISTAKQIFETNFFGVMRVCQAVLPYMRNQGKGQIINISSIAGEISLPFRGIYSASKGALEAMSEAMRMELKPFGVQVVILQPGGYKTALQQHRIHVRPDSDSPYELLFKSMEAQIADEMRHAPGPEPVGHQVEKVAKSMNPAIRYRVGPLLEVITPLLKKILPDTLNERILMAFFKLNKKKLKK